MKSFAEALSLLDSFASQCADRHKRTEWVKLLHAAGRVLATNINAEQEHPPYDCYALDGYAVRVREVEKVLTEPDASLQVVGPLSSSQKESAATLPEKTALRVVKGTPLVEGFDSVIPEGAMNVSSVDEQGLAGFVRPKGAAVRGHGLCFRGTDIAVGQVVLEKGTRLESQHLLLLGSLGKPEVSVLAKPRVAILATGKELRDISEPISTGETHNATSLFLSSALSQAGCEVTLFGTVEDDPARFEKLVQRILEGGFDVIVTTGGMGGGWNDVVASSLEKIGAKIHFHETRLHPGGSSSFCSFPSREGRPETVGFALSGSPTATAAAFRFLVMPYLRSFQGMRKEHSTRVVLGNSVIKPPAVRASLLGSVAQTHQGLVAYVSSEQESFRVLPLSRSQVWVVLPEVASGASAGDLVEIYPLLGESGIF